MIVIEVVVHESKPADVKISWPAEPSAADYARVAAALDVVAGIHRKLAEVAH